MGTSLLSIGITGLNAAQAGILTTGHNIANASTPGYSRQQIAQSTNIPDLTSGGYIGQGTNVQTVTRAYNQYLNLQVLGSQTNAQEMTSYEAQISQIENLLGDPSAGLSPALAAFFQGVSDASANPSSVAGRQSMIAQAQGLVSRFQDLDGRLTSIRDGVNAQIGSEVTMINSLASQIADVNQRIIAAQAVSESQPANDLLDQRDQLLNQLNKEVRVSTTTQSDGTYSVFIGNGQPLVVGTQVSTLQAVPDGSDPQKTVISFQIPGSGSATLSDSLISGGNLGGLLSFRNASLDAAQNALGRVAIGLASAFNQQHQLGQDLNGLVGGAFFTVATPAVFANSSNANNGNGNPAVTISSVAALTTSDYRLSCDGTNYSLLRLSDNTVTPLTTVPQTVDGISIDTSALTPTAKDNWLIEPTRYGARNISVAITDPNAVALAAPISTSASGNNTGGGSIDAGTVTDTTNAAFATPGSLTPPISIVFNNPPTTYNVYDNTVPGSLATSLDTNVAYTAGGNVFPTPLLTGYGYQVVIGGTPAAGDTFTVGANSNGVADNRNGLALAQLQTQKLLGASGNGAATASLQAAYSQLVSEVGSKSNEVQVTGAAQQSLADQAQTARDSYSAVNLDEEAANLLKYQQAYQASAHMMSTASKLFDTLLQI